MDNEMKLENLNQLYETLIIAKNIRASLLKNGISIDNETLSDMRASGLEVDLEDLKNKDIERYDNLIEEIEAQIKIAKIELNIVTNGYPD